MWLLPGGLDMKGEVRILNNADLDVTVLESGTKIIKLKEI